MSISPQHAHACLLGVMIGDGLGAPVESMTRAEIAEKTGGEGVRDFIAPLQWRIKDTVHLQPGQTTDDWQLTRTVAQSLIVANGYDQHNMALAHVQAMEERSIGWGGTTDIAVKELQQWFATDGAAGRSTQTPVGNLGDGMGGGNGVAMKCAPLAIFHAARNDRDALISDLYSLATMTHVKPEPYWCALAFSLILYDTLVTGKLPRLDVIIDELAILAAGMPDCPAAVTLQQLQRVDELLSDPEAIYTQVGPKFSAIESVPYTIGMTYAGIDDPTATMLRIINDGGDSDSTAAMSGAIMGAYAGLDAFPARWQTFRSEYDEAGIVATALLPYAS